MADFRMQKSSAPLQGRPSSLTRSVRATSSSSSEMQDLWLGLSESFREPKLTERSTCVMYLHIDGDCRINSIFLKALHHLIATPREARRIHYKSGNATWVCFCQILILCACFRPPNPPKLLSQGASENPPLNQRHIPKLASSERCMSICTDYSSC